MKKFNLSILALALSSFTAIYSASQVRDQRLACINKYFGDFDITHPDDQVLDNILNAEKETLQSYAKCLKAHPECCGLITYARNSNWYIPFKGPKEVYSISLSTPGKLWGSCPSNSLICEGGRMDIYDAKNNRVNKGPGGQVYHCVYSENGVPNIARRFYDASRIFDALKILHEAESQS